MARDSMQGLGHTRRLTRPLATLFLPLRSGSYSGHSGAQKVAKA